MRYFVTFSYDGTRYHGWQIQPNGDSVQARLQGALSLLLRSEIIVTGAGRTDAGVHARMMVAHFDFPCEIDGRQLAYKLNKLLPRDIPLLGHQPHVPLLPAYREESVSHQYFMRTALSTGFQQDERGGSRADGV